MSDLLFKLGSRRVSKSSLRKFGRLLVLAVLSLLAYRHVSRAGNGRDLQFAHPALMDPAFVGDWTDEQLASETYRRYRFETGSSWIDSYSLQRNLLRVWKGPHRGSKVGSIDELAFYDSDPRLAWTVYLDYFMKPDLLSNEEIEFSWYDWADFGDWNKLVSLEKTPVNCSVVFGKLFDVNFLREAEAEVGDVLFLSERACYDDESWYRKQQLLRNRADSPPSDLARFCEARSPGRFQLPFEVAQLHEGVRPEVFTLQARSHLLSHVAHPLSLAVMERDIGCYRLGVGQSGRRNLVESGLLGRYLEKHESEIDAHGDIKFDHLAAYERFLNDPVSAGLKIKIRGTNRKITEQETVSLSPDDFEVNVTEIIEELRRSKAENTLSNHELRYLESLEHSITVSPWLASKYFPEAERIKGLNNMGSHRDLRFFKDALIWDPEEYNARLNSLIRNWLKFARANGLITWIAHGSAYGHLYNGQKFPWDNDYDVQMPIKHLHLLSRYFNQSLILEDPREGNGKFLLDVGDSITVRTPGNGRNCIDARFIDIDSGLYVDITGISVSSSPMHSNFKSFYDVRAPSVDLKSKLKAFELPERGQGLNALDVYKLADYVAAHSELFQRDQIKDVNNGKRAESQIQTQDTTLQHGLTPEERYIMNRELKVYNCRNDHFISLDLLSPLRSSLFHGVPAFFPKHNLAVLRNEYNVPAVYGFHLFEGKAFLPALHSWFTYSVLQDFTKINEKYPGLEKLEGTVSDVQIEDVEIILKNMLQLGLTELFAIHYTSFNATAYRVKELEIQYDETIDRSERERLLHTLWTQVSPKVSSPAKDPFMFNYERKLWREMVGLLGNEKSQESQAAVEQAVLQQLSSEAQKMHRRELQLFRIFNSSGELMDDLNTVVKALPNANVIFKEEPDI